MSEETQETNDGTWSGLKKTLIGTLTTVIAGGGIWVSTHLFGGASEEKAEPKTEQAAPAPAPVININNTQQQSQAAGTTTIIRERTVEKQAQPKEAKKETKKDETDSPW